MNFPRDLIVILTYLGLFHTGGHVALAAGPVSVFSFFHDLIQNNVAGVPLIHERTEWDFDPEVGKQRRVRYEQDNGRHGEIAIAKIGMGIGYKGPWGTSV